MELSIDPVDKTLHRTMPDTKLGFGQHFSDHMFVMDYVENQGWNNARIVPYAPFTLNPAAMVFHYGQAIFEGLKAYRGKDGTIHLFRPKDNFERMNISAHRMCMPEFDADFALAALKKLIDLDQKWVPDAEGASLYIRPTMIATEEALGVRPAKRYRFFIITSPVGAYYPEGFSPTKILVSDTYVRAVRGGVGHVKTAGNYAASIMAAVEAAQQGFTQVLWLDAVHRKYVEEVGTSNIFFVIHDRVVTPSLTGSILPGITRDSVVHLVRQWGRAPEERLISIEEVIEASENGSLQEVFATGTAAVISPVGELSYQGKRVIINNGAVGPLAQKLYETLLRIQYGTGDDPYGWRVPVTSP